VKKIIDTQETDDPNVFGEILREYAFKEAYGCYTCFELIDEFKKVDKGYDIAGRLFMVMGIHQLQDANKYACEYFRGISQIYSNGAIHVGWYWDGDGTLAFIEGNKSAINYDCKKDYTWEWREC
jgi:hypothetical protein